MAVGHITINDGLMNVDDGVCKDALKTSWV